MRATTGQDVEIARDFLTTLIRIRLAKFSLQNMDLWQNIAIYAAFLVSALNQDEDEFY